VAWVTPLVTETPARLPEVETQSTVRVTALKRKTVSPMEVERVKDHDTVNFQQILNGMPLNNQ
jgi:hypothetical protein